MYEKINEMTRRRACRSGKALKNEEGKIFMEKDKVKRRWEEYSGELFEYERREDEEEVKVVEVMEIIKDKVQHVMSKLKRRKAKGEDGVMMEMLEALGEFRVDKVKSSEHHLYNSRVITTQGCRSILTAISKLCETHECNKHRTISLINHIIKIILREIIN